MKERSNSKDDMKAETLNLRLKTNNSQKWKKNINNFVNFCKDSSVILPWFFRDSFEILAGWEKKRGLRAILRRNEATVR